KPGNVLLDGGEPLVADFGLARLLDREGDSRRGEPVGTPAYMAPEAAAGRGQDCGAAADVWSLGVMLYELLRGRRPFLGRGLELARQVQDDPPPRPGAVRRDLPRDLEVVLLRCLEKDPAQRYTRAGELADDLARWLRAEAVLAQPSPWHLRLGSW